MQYVPLKKNSGFTIVEIIVVIAIIISLSTVILFSIISAKAQARDATRLVDIEQYQLAFKLYVEQYGELPVCPKGAYLRASGIITAKPSPSSPTDGCQHIVQMQSFFNRVFGQLPTDPQDDGSANPAYAYYYDSQHDACGNHNGPGPNPPILTIKQMEGTPPIAPQVVCDGDPSPLGGDGGLVSSNNVYLIRLDQ